MWWRRWPHAAIRRHHIHSGIDALRKKVELSDCPSNDRLDGGLRLVQVCGDASAVDVLRGLDLAKGFSHAFKDRQRLLQDLTYK